VDDMVDLNLMVVFSNDWAKIGGCSSKKQEKVINTPSFLGGDLIFRSKMCLQ
jgi:hypothetical protein